ncbi:MAG: EAL domain-containing protein [Gammaproteobacteria bacterium]|nr:EAL domain-containing protein [Gammaproteobacteria bacterium]
MDFVERRTIAPVRTASPTSARPARLRISDAELCGLYDHISDVIAVVDRAGRLMHVSPSVTAVFGYDPVELVGRPVIEFVAPPGSDRISAALETLFAEPGVSQRVEFTGRHADGTTRVAVATGHAVRYAAQRSPVVVLTVRDVTVERAQAQALEQTRQAAEDYRRAVERSGVMLFHWLPHRPWKVLFVSDNVRQLGYEPQEFITGGLTYADIMEAADLDMIDRDFEAWLRTDVEEFTGIYRVRTRGGHTRWVDERTVRVRDPAGGVQALIGLIVDVTDHKLAELALERKSRALATLGEGNHRLIRARTETELYASVCEGIVAAGRYRLAWVGLARTDARRSIEPVACAGPARAYVDAITVSWDGSSVHGRGPSGSAVRSGRITVARGIPTTPEFEPWREAARTHGFGASIALPFEADAGQRGVLNIYAEDPDAFDGEEQAVLGEMAKDIAYGLQIVRLTAAQARSAAQMRALYDDNPTTYITIAADGTIVSINRFGAEQLGYDVDALTTRSVYEIIHGDDRESARRVITAALERRGELQQAELRKRRSDGELRWNRETVRAIDTPDGIRVLMVCEDITDARELSEQLSYQATHDPLTGLTNRREFEHRVHDALNTAATELVEHALCYIDLDQFKVVNDTCGHVAGDELLRQLTQLLQRRVRGRDTLARLGGDEFGVLMENCTISHATQVAEQLLDSIREFRFAWQDKTFHVAASIGLVAITSASTAVERLLAMADEACYAAKDLGRSRVHVYHESDQELARRHGEMLWVARINSALAENRLQLAWQRIAPLAAVTDGARLCGELLVRMRDESGTVIGPGAFLPAAERFGISPRLDLWVVRTAFEWLAARPTLQARLDFLSINLSALSLGDPPLHDYILTFFERRPDLASCFCFEITETAAIANFATALQFINSLQQFGCRFALDDFGSGLSSFAYLKTLPVDLLKIDGSFVRTIASDPIDLAMVRSINEIGHVMGKITVAEFVEDADVLTQLRTLGVDYGQGYGIARPQPLATLEAAAG